MNPAGILLNDTIRSYSLHFIANSSSSWSLTLALQQSHDLFVSGSPPIHREWKKATTSNLKLSGHFFWKRTIDSLLIIHQTCICSCSMFFHFQNEIISWTLISLCSSRFRQELSQKKRRGEKEWPSAATWSRGLNISPELRLVQWYNAMMPWWTSGLAAHRLSISLLNDCVPGVYIFLPKKNFFPKQLVLGRVNLRDRQRGVLCIGSIQGAKLELDSRCRVSTITTSCGGDSGTWKNNHRLRYDTIYGLISIFLL